MTRAVDFDKFYCNARLEINYEKYFNSGEKKITESNDYTSEKPYKLNENELIEILMNLDYVKNNLNENFIIGSGMMGHKLFTYL